jgi:hypothetical protein
VLFLAPAGIVAKTDEFYDVKFDDWIHFDNPVIVNVETRLLLAAEAYAV